MTMMLMPNILMTFMFNYFKHPMSMTLIIISQAFIMCSSMSLIAKTFWMSYILFLVFLGGMLVLFLYITSLAPNEMFSASTMKYPTVFIISMWFTMLMTISLTDKLSWNMFLLNTDSHSISFMNMLISNSNQSMMLVKLYNTPSSILTLMTIMYLLLTLIATVKITNIQLGPIRSNN
nr:NADH dehydrogenase subunit 6 [Onomarchus uninotatus]